MARGQRKSDATVSLFPFLSILACVIGTLTLIIAGLVVSQVGGGTVSSAEEYEGITNTISDDNEEVRRLRRLIAEASALEKLLAEYRKEVDSSDDMRAVATLMQKQSELRKKIKEAEAALKQLRDKITELGIKLTDKQNSSERIIVLKASGLGRGLKPSFVECKVDKLIIYPEKISVRKSAIKGNTFRSHVQQIKRRRGMSIVLLIRPDGVKTFEEAQKVVKKLGVRYGYLPLPGNGPIDFGIWKTGRR